MMSLKSLLLVNFLMKIFKYVTLGNTHGALGDNVISNKYLNEMVEASDCIPEKFNTGQIFNENSEFENSEISVTLTNTHSALMSHKYLNGTTETSSDIFQRFDTC